MSVVNLFSPNWHPADSYGRIARELASGFETLGIYVNCFGDDAPLKPLKPCVGGIFLGYPTMHEEFIEMFPLAGHGHRIAITMFESTKLPDKWAEALNQCDHVIVSARFLVDVFRSSGVGAPISVIPLGMSEAYTKAVTRRNTTDPFTFLAIADRALRKNWDKVLYAFVRAFGDSEKYKLILKRRGQPARFTNPNISFISEDYSDEEMAELYHRCHAMVFPSSGEGFGLPPREFAATGGVSLVANWGGLADDIHQWGIPLPVLMGDAWREKDEWYGELGQWADIDIDLLAEQMKYIADNFDSYRDFGIRAGGFVRSHYRWQTFCNRVHEIWSNSITIKEESDANHFDRTEIVAS